MRTTLKLRILRETPLARYYEKPGGKTQWVPRSVCPTVTKLGDIHEVTIEDWWLKQNPFETRAQDQPNLL